MQFTEQILFFTESDRENIAPSKTLRAKPENILKVHNDMQFTDRKLFLTDR